MTLIDTALDAFNHKDAALFNSIFGGDVVIVDGFAPFSLDWSGCRGQMVERRRDPG